MTRRNWLALAAMATGLSGCGLMDGHRAPLRPGDDPNSLPPSAKLGGYYRRDRWGNWKWYPKPADVAGPTATEPIM